MYQLKFAHPAISAIYPTHSNVSGLGAPSPHGCREKALLPFPPLKATYRLSEVSVESLPKQRLIKVQGAIFSWKIKHFPAQGSVISGYSARFLSFPQCPLTRSTVSWPTAFASLLMSGWRGSGQGPLLMWNCLYHQCSHLFTRIFVFNYSCDTLWPAKLSLASPLLFLTALEQINPFAAGIVVNQLKIIGRRMGFFPWSLV